MDKKKNIVVSLAAIASIILASLTFGYYEYSRSNDDPVTAKPEVYISAAALLNEFLQSENNANEKYFSRLTCTQGILKRIDTDQNSIYNVALIGDSDREICCQLHPRHSDDLQSLHSGDTVEVRGICAGMVNDIILVGCSVKKTNAITL
jgi:hypothetical protein